MTYIAAVLITVLIVGLWAWRSARHAGQRSTVPGLASELDRLETLLLGGESQQAAGALGQIDSRVMAGQGQAGNLLRARFRLSAGDFFAWTGRPEPARERFEQALTDCYRVTDPAMALELRTRAEASLGLLASAENADPELGARGRAALDCEPQVRRPEVVMRMVWIAHHLARLEHVQGHWQEARTLFERAVAVGRRLQRPGEGVMEGAWDQGARDLFWSKGRSVASEAARDLAVVLESLGDREGTMRWLDEAVALMEGSTMPIARLRLAQALIERATHEPVDAFTGIAGHETLLGRAAEVALSCGTDDGMTMACRAEVARSELYPALGMTEKRLEHLRRAAGLTGHMTEPAAGHNQTFLHMVTGFALEDHGDRAGAVASHQRAVERGRVHPDPDARKLAAQSAYRLHQLFLEDERTSDARHCVEVLEELIPTLMPQERPSFAAVTAHSRGMQHMLEGRPDEARRSLEQAETMAQQAGATALVRAVAMDQGRLALRLEQPAEALPHLRRALETAVTQVDSLEDRARRAEILMSMADTLMALDQPDAALRECRRAFDMGRDAGSARGREVAAVAAMHLGEAAGGDVALRRRYFETALRLGRLSGGPRGRQVADIVEGRLDDLAG